MHALLMLAALMQLCAPLLHAQAMADGPARFVDAAFCGDNLRGQRLQLRNQLPAEVRAAMARNQPDTATAAAPACDDCVCASPVALPATIGGWAPTIPNRQPTPERGLPWVALSGSALPPPSTGPPDIAIARLIGDGHHAVVSPDL